ncbi:MAG: tetratricopeptide repeat protein [Acidobacteriota bacterium]|nr:MAG: tetratricopeptide repeat protein [Acidobacteriota bacterium]
MPEEISIEAAGENLISCAVFLADNIKSGEARAAALTPLIERLLGKSDVDLAALYADNIGDPFLRDRMLIRVVAKCVEIGDDEYARQLVDAIDEDRARATALETFALQKSAKGEFDEAIRVAEDLEHSSEAFAGIAVNLAAKGEESRALETLQNVDFFSSRVDAMVEIAGIYDRTGKNAEAVAMLEKALAECTEIEFEEDRIRAYLQLGSAFVDSGRKDLAIEALEKGRVLAEAIEGGHRDNVLANIAVGFLLAGSVDLADRALDLVADKTQLASALVGFSKIYVDDEDVEEATEAVEEALAILKSQGDKEIRDSKARFNVFKEISIQFARVGKFERAMEIAQQSPDPALVKNALVNIAQVMILRGEDELARQAMNALPGEAERVAALLTSSDAKNSLGLKEEAVAYVDEAEQLVDSVPQQIMRAEILTEIAKRYEFYGESEKARAAASHCLESVPDILGGGNRAAALCDLSEVYDKNGYEVSAEDKEVLENVIKLTLA